MLIRLWGLLAVSLILLTMLPEDVWAQSVTPSAAASPIPASAPASPSSAPTSADGTWVDQPIEQALAEKYSPIVSIRQQSRPCDRSGEGYYPIGVESVLGDQDVVLKQRTGSNSREDRTIKIAPNAQDLVGLGADFYLDWPGDPIRPGCTFETWFKQRAAELGTGPVTYAHFVIDQSNNRIYLQYWMWYTFNDWNNTHEGDWEMVQLEWDTTSLQEAAAREPARLGYAQHGGGELADWTDHKVLKSGDHIVAFPAAGSHGTFFGSEIYIGWGENGSGFGCDVTTSPQQQALMSVVLVPDVPSTTGDFAWLYFGGRWGERMPTIWDGPLGPNVNRRWTDPFGAIELWRSTSLYIPTSTIVGPNATELFCNLTRWGSKAVTRLVLYPWLAILLFVTIIGAIVWLIRQSWGQITAARRVFADDRRVYLGIGLISIPIGILFNIVDSWVRRRPPVDFLMRWFSDTAGARLSVALALGGLQQFVMLLVLAPPVIQAIMDRRAGIQPSIQRSFRLTWKRMPKLAVAYIVVVAFVGVLATTLFLIPLAIYFAVAWQFTPQAMYLDKVDSPLHCITVSRATVGRHWWRALKISLVYQLLLWIPGPFIGALLIIFGRLAVSYANTLSGIVYALCVPMAIIGLTLAYENLKLLRAASEPPASEVPADPGLSQLTDPV